MKLSAKNGVVSSAIWKKMFAHLMPKTTLDPSLKRKGERGCYSVG